jgi:hypothetical protein
MEQQNDAAAPMLGHNIQNATVRVEVRFFNSLSCYSLNGGRPVIMQIPAGSTVGDVIRRLDIPSAEVYLALRNGRDITRSLYDPVNEDALLDEGDVLALSGPVPYSWGYGSPVV